MTLIPGYSFHNSRLSEDGKIMWKRRETVTETERCKIVEIADKYKVPMRDETSEFQSGVSFDDINYHLQKG